MVRADARIRLRDLRHPKRGDDIRGILGAYVADQYLLGKGSVGRAEIHRQRRAGRVRAGFERLLLRTLKSWKYR
ncbi:MAG: hypothetical protein JWQ20_3550 [Conexibacter sp.]|nr:hypothetical protein [Conexibacter sp.]